MNDLPRSLIAPKATRVLRALLLHREKPWRVTELAKASQVSPAYGVRLTRILAQEGYLHRDGKEYRLSNPRVLLSRWADVYRFGKGGAIHRFVVAGDPTAVDDRLAEVAGKLNTRYALTLFAGARHRAPFVRYPGTHAYIEGDPSTLADALGARPISDQGNLFLINPQDSGVFFGSQRIGNIEIASDVQLYLDLFNFEARGREQADFILEKLLPDLMEADTPESRASFHEALRVRDEGDLAFGRRDYSNAVKSYEELARRLSSFSANEATQELNRARLLLWMALAHTAYEAVDQREGDSQGRSYLDRAREIFVTASEVESLRRQVGYNPSVTALAIMAYYAALFRETSEPSERSAYLKKVEAQGAILRSPYMQGAKEVVAAAEAIWAEISRPHKNQNPWSAWGLEYRILDGNPVISASKLSEIQARWPGTVIRGHKGGRPPGASVIRLDRRYKIGRQTPEGDTYFLHPIEPADVEIRIDYETKDLGGGNRHQYELVVSLTNQSLQAIKDFRVEIELPTEIFREHDSEESQADGSLSPKSRTIVVYSGQIGDPLFKGMEVEVLRIPYVFTHKTYQLVEGSFSRRDLLVRVRLYGDGIAPILEECSMRELNCF